MKHIWEKKFVWWWSQAASFSPKNFVLPCSMKGFFSFNKELNIFIFQSQVISCHHCDKVAVTTVASLTSEVKSYFSNTKTFLKSMMLNWGYIYQRRDLKCYVLFALSLESFIFTFSKNKPKKNTVQRHTHHRRSECDVSELCTSIFLADPTF